MFPGVSVRCFKMRLAFELVGSVKQMGHLLPVAGHHLTMRAWTERKAGERGICPFSCLTGGLYFISCLGTRIHIISPGSQTPELRLKITPLSPLGLHLAGEQMVELLSLNNQVSQFLRINLYLYLSICILLVLFLWRTPTSTYNKILVMI